MQSEAERWALKTVRAEIYMHASAQAEKYAALAAQYAAEHRVHGRVELKERIERMDALADMWSEIAAAHYDDEE